MSARFLKFLDFSGLTVHRQNGNLRLIMSITCTWPCLDMFCLVKQVHTCSQPDASPQYFSSARRFQNQTQFPMRRRPADIPALAAAAIPRAGVGLEIGDHSRERQCEPIAPVKGRRQSWPFWAGQDRGPVQPLGSTRRGEKPIR